jgi:glycosyltransferase involved in cell wall biosynthesis
VLSQPIDVRVLVIDDASTDDSAVIGERLAREDSRVTFRRHETNIGHIATYNEGLIGWARQEYSLLLSADDVVAPGALARAARALDRHPDAGFVYGMGVLFAGEVPKMDDDGGDPEYRLIPGLTFVRHCFEQVNPLETPTAVVRTAWQQKLGGYRKELPHTGDVEMWMRFAVQGPVVALRSVQAFVRRHTANMSGGYYRHRLRDCRQVIAAGDTIVREWGDRLPDIASWRQSMGARVSVDACWFAIRSFENADLSDYREAMAFAEEINPQIRRLPVWWKAKARGAIGPRLWNALHPLLQRVKFGEPPAPVVNPTTVPLSGWWPTIS